MVYFAEEEITCCSENGTNAARCWNTQVCSSLTSQGHSAGKVQPVRGNSQSASFANFVQSNIAIAAT